MPFRSARPIRHLIGSARTRPPYADFAAAGVSESAAPMVNSSIGAPGFAPATRSLNARWPGARHLRLQPAYRPDLPQTQHRGDVASQRPRPDRPRRRPARPNGRQREAAAFGHRRRGRGPMCPPWINIAPSRLATGRTHGSAPTKTYPKWSNAPASTGRTTPSSPCIRNGATSSRSTISPIAVTVASISAAATRIVSNASGGAVKSSS